jgi:hypothetical protein
VILRQGRNGIQTTLQSDHETLHFKEFIYSLVPDDII